MKIKTLQEKEYDLIEKVLKETGWNLERASRLLQIPISQLKRKINKHGMKKAASGDLFEPKNNLKSEL
jgi:DNA-binding NtrC family response regulator